MKTKQVGIYTITEPKVGQVFPIMGLMATNPEQFQLQLAGLCIFKDGVAIGETGVNDLGIKEYMDLMKEVMAVAGFGEEK